MLTHASSQTLKSMQNQKYWNIILHHLYLYICDINIEADVFSLIKTELCLLNFRFWYLRHRIGLIKQILFMLVDPLEIFEWFSQHVYTLAVSVCSWLRLWKLYSYWNVSYGLFSLLRVNIHFLCPPYPQPPGNFFIP